MQWQISDVPHFVFQLRPHPLDATRHDLCVHIFVWPLGRARHSTSTLCFSLFLRLRAPKDKRRPTSGDQPPSRPRAFRFLEPGRHFLKKIDGQRHLSAESGTKLISRQIGLKIAQNHFKTLNYIPIDLYGVQICKLVYATRSYRKRPQMALNVDGAQQLEFDVWTVQGEEKHFAFLKDNFCFSTVSGLFSFGCVIRFLGKSLKWRPSSFDARRRHFMFLFPLFWLWNWWKGPSICLERLLFQLKEFRSFWSQKNDTPSRNEKNSILIHWNIQTNQTFKSCVAERVLIPEIYLKFSKLDVEEVERASEDFLRKRDVRQRKSKQGGNVWVLGVRSDVESLGPHKSALWVDGPLQIGSQQLTVRLFVCLIFDSVCRSQEMWWSAGALALSSFARWII